MRLETHIHTKEVSSCSACSAAEAVSRCVRLGYDGMVLTDHFSPYAHAKKRKIFWQDRVTFFLKGYLAAREAAPEGFTVLLGMEVSLLGANNDYLVYGVNEAFLRRYEAFDFQGLAKFSKLAHDSGLMVFQAHPFRFGSTIMKPQLLDGIEAYNGNANHESHNAIALAWAETCGLLPISGSDYHGEASVEGAAPGGIELPGPVRDNEEFIHALKSREYTLLHEEPPTETQPFAKDRYSPPWAGALK